MISKVDYRLAKRGTTTHGGMVEQVYRHDKESEGITVLPLIAELYSGIMVDGVLTIDPTMLSLS